MGVSKATIVTLGAIAALTVALLVMKRIWPRSAEAYAEKAAGVEPISPRKPSEKPRSPIGSSVGKAVSYHSDSASVADFYHLVFAGLDLTAAEKEGLLGYLTKKERIAGDLKAKFANGAGYPSVDAINGEISSANRSIEAVYVQISLLLGETRFAQFRNLEGSIPASNTLTAIDQILGASDTHLDDQQSQQLLALLDPPHPRIEASDPMLLTSLRKASSGGLTASTDLRSHQGASVTPQTLLDAVSFLSPPEIAALKTAKDSWRNQGLK